MSASRADGPGAGGPGGGRVVEKYQTLGNCYLLLDPQRNGMGAGDLPDLDWVRRICDPHFGIGSDGLLVGPECRPGGAFAFRILNSDGSRAQFSGNGSRIFARYLFDAGYAPGPAARLHLAALSADGEEVHIGARLLDGMPDGALATDMEAPLRMGMDAVSADPARVRANGEYFTVDAVAELGRRLFSQDAWARSALLSIGNPHCVTTVQAREFLPALPQLEALGEPLAAIANVPQSAGSAPFAGGCNLQWIWVESPRRLHLRIVERGEGPTLASGSSASAAAIAAFVRGQVGPELSVVMPGGELPVRLNRGATGGMEVRLTATVGRIATCCLF